MIRKAKEEDIDSVLEITKSCAAHMVDYGIFQWNEFYPNRSAFENDVKRDELFVLENKKSIIGCIVISTFMDIEYEPIKWLTQDKNNFYIHRLAVHPEFQGQGFAHQLMDYAEALGKENNCISIRLDTFSQNLKNQKFYEQRGYQKLGNIYFPKQSEFPFYCYELIL
ncbi:MAG: GNAT family N-acetyltransferase [Gelidibacter sp.]